MNPANLVVTRQEARAAETPALEIPPSEPSLDSAAIQPEFPCSPTDWIQAVSSTLDPQRDTFAIRSEIRRDAGDNFSEQE